MDNQVKSRFQDILNTLSNAISESRYSVISSSLTDITSLHLSHLSELQDLISDVETADLGNIGLLFTKLMLFSSLHGKNRNLDVDFYREFISLIEKSLNSLLTSEGLVFVSFKNIWDILSCYFDVFYHYWCDVASLDSERKLGYFTNIYILSKLWNFMSVTDGGKLESSDKSPATLKFFILVTVLKIHVVTSVWAMAKITLDVIEKTRKSVSLKSYYELTSFVDYYYYGALTMARCKDYDIAIRMSENAIGNLHYFSNIDKSNIKEFYTLRKLGLLLKLLSYLHSTPLDKRFLGAKSKTSKFYDDFNINEMDSETFIDLFRSVFPKLVSTSNVAYKADEVSFELNEWIRTETIPHHVDRFIQNKKESFSNVISGFEGKVNGKKACNFVVGSARVRDQEFYDKGIHRPKMSSFRRYPGSNLDKEFRIDMGKTCEKEAQVSAFDWYLHEISRLKAENSN